MEPPVIILGLARSGTSLLTKIVGSHGLHIGIHRDKNGHGYCDYEDRELMSFLRSHWPQDAQKTNFPKPKLKFRRFVDSLLVKDGRYVIKGFIPLWRVWVCDFPDADYILTVRNIEEVTDSAWEKGHHGRPRSEVRDFIAGWQDEVYMVSKLLNRPIVNMSDVVQGRYDDLEKALRLCGINLDPSKVDACIDKGLWKHEQVDCLVHEHQQSCS